MWVDKSSFSKGDVERIPNSWAYHTSYMTVTVHRHIHYEKDDWLLSAYGLFDNKVLKNKDIDLAKKEALILVKSKLEKIISEIND